MGVNETIKNINATLRTLLMTVLVGGAGYAGYFFYGAYNEPQKKLADKQAELQTALDRLNSSNEKLADSEKQNDELKTRVEKLEVAKRLLKVRHRLAHLKVLDQNNDPESGKMVSRLDFVEVNDEGLPIGKSLQFDIIGNLVYIDYLKVTFDDRYIEQSDLNRSTAICLFQRIFGEHQNPVDGVQIDSVGTRPTAYARGTSMSDFEKKIWDDFWLIANDPARAESLGIHGAHEEAVGKRVERGKTYQLELRATGEPRFEPIETVER